MMRIMSTTEHNLEHNSLFLRAMPNSITLDFGSI